MSPSDKSYSAWAVRREPDDSLADLRVSLGSKRGIGAYMVFRGNPEEVVKLLEDALNVAREALPAGRYTDSRGRPQG